MNKKLKLSKRVRVSLGDNEKTSLASFLDTSNAGYATIKTNTGISKVTIDRTLERGWLELQCAVKLREFLKMAKEEGLIPEEEKTSISI